MERVFSLSLINPIYHTLRFTSTSFRNPYIRAS